MKQALEASGGDMHIVDDAEDWEVLEVLGMGTFGQAELRRSFDPEFADDFVVIKRVPVKALSDWAVGALMSELVNGMAMHHEHIVRMYGAYLSDRGEVCMALQYAAGGTLDDTVKLQESRGHFPSSTVTAWLSQLCAAIEHLSLIHI